MDLTQPFVEEFLRHAPSAIAMFDRELRYLMVTDRWLSDYGLENTDIIGRSHYEIFPEIPNDWRELHQRTLDGETLSAEADAFLRQDGSLDWVRWRNVPWYEADGEVGGMIMFTEVITDQVFMQKAMEHAVGGVARLNAGGRFVFVNETYAGILGRTPKDMMGRPFSDFFAADDLPRLSEAMQKMQASGNASVVAGSDMPDGEKVHAEITMVADISREGDFAGHFSFLEDVTARVTREEANRRQTEWLKMTQSMGNIGHWFVDFRQQSVYWSDEVFRIHGVSPDTFKPDLDSAINFYHPDDRKMVEEAINAAISGRKPFSFQLRILRPDGTMRWVSSDGECRLDENGTVVAIFGVFQDITHSRAQTEELRRVKEQSELAMRSAAVGVWDFNPYTMKGYWSDLLNELLGRERHEAPTSDDVLKWTHPEDKDALAKYIETLYQSGKAAAKVARFRHADGHYVFLEIRGDAIHEDGKVVKLTGSFADISEEKKSEALRQELWKILILQGVRQSDKFTRVLEKASEYFGMEIGLISQVEGETYTVLHAVTPDNGLSTGDTFDYQNTYCENVFEADRPKAFHHVGQSEIRLHPCYKHFSLEAYIGATTFVAGRRYGTVNFSSPLPRRKPFSSMDILLIEQIAQWVGYEIEREQNIASLRESEERFALAAKGSSVGIWDWRDVTVDEEFWSDHFYSLLGYAAGEIEASIGNFRELLHPEDRKQAFDALERHFARKTAYHVEYRLKCKDGQYKWFLGTGQAIWDSLGRPRRMIGSIMDIHERKKAEHLKSEFVSTVSHELRTPMTSIMGSISLIRSGRFGDLDPKTAQLLDIASKNGDRLVRLINDILDIEKMEAGRIEFTMKPVDLEELLQEAISQNQAFADKHQSVLTLESDIPAAEILGDRDRLIQVLTNLISNAAKFTPEGGKIKVNAALHDDHLSISVTDDGPGIPPDKLEMIFDRFVQIDSGDSRANQGTGLGLSISKAIVEAHDGDLYVDSVVGWGTTFSVVLPMHHVALLDSGPAQKGQDGPRKRILHVEDDTDTTSLFRHLVGDLADVDTVRSVVAARNALRNRTYDLVLLDLQLADNRGEAVIEFMEAEFEMPPPVIIYSVDDVPMERFPAFVLGRFVKSRATNEMLLEDIMHVLHQNSLSNRSSARA